MDDIKVITAWSKHCEVSYYVAAHDIDTMVSAIGPILALRFVTMKMAGNTTTSLNQFCKDNGITVDWTRYL